MLEVKKSLKQNKKFEVRKKLEVKIKVGSGGKSLK